MLQVQPSENVASCLTTCACMLTLCKQLDAPLHSEQRHRGCDVLRGQMLAVKGTGAWELSSWKLRFRRLQVVRFHYWHVPSVSTPPCMALCC